MVSGLRGPYFNKNEPLDAFNGLRGAYSLDFARKHHDFGQLRASESA